MHERAKVISRFYLVAGVWFVVMLLTALALLQPLGNLYAALDLTPTARAAATMVLAVAVATTAAAIIWSRVRTSGGRSQRAVRPTDQGSQGDAQATATP